MIAHMCGAGVEKKRYLNTVLRVPDIILSRESIYVFFFGDWIFKTHDVHCGIPGGNEGL